MREYGSEYSITIHRNSYFETLLRQYPYSVLVRTGREALALAAQCISHEPGDIVLIPAYCCRTMEWPFQDYGWTLEYFSLNSDLTVNIEDLKKRILMLSPKAVLLMNYYGFTDISEAVKTIRETTPDVVVIEDFSHTLLTENQINTSPSRANIRIASIRKSIGVADGGIFLSEIPFNPSKVKQQENTFSTLRLEAEREKEKFSYTYEEELRASFKDKLTPCGDKFLKPHKSSSSSISGV